MLSKYLKTILNGGVPETPSDPLAEGLAAYEAGDHAQAMEKLLIALEADPYQVDALGTLARIHLERGENAEALAHLQTAIQFDAYNPQLYYSLGEASFGLNDLFAAERHYARSTELNPDFTDAFIRQGMVLSELGRREDAIKAFERAIFLDRAAVVARYHLAQVCLQLEDYRRALTQLHMVKELHPTYAPVYLLQGDIQQRLGDARQAVVEYEKAVELGAGDADVFWQLGELHLGLQNRDKALKAFQQVVDIDPGHFPAQMQLARMHEEAKRLLQAQQAYEALVASEEYGELAREGLARISAVLAEIAASMSGGADEAAGA
ncbi:MAG TPA: tetratricopeptide repeat protein [Oscillatoriaceae cyanobacterium]